MEELSHQSSADAAARVYAYVPPEPGLGSVPANAASPAHASPAHASRYMRRASDLYQPFGPARILEEIGYGVMVVNASAQIRMTNRLARAELQRGQAMVDRGGRLAAANACQHRGLAEALQRAASGRRVMLELGADEPTTMLALSPLAGPDGLHNGHVLVLLSKRAPADTVTLALYAKAMGMTPTEQVVLAGICDGLAAHDIARLHDIQVCTVRTHIGRIRAKMGVRSVLQVISRVAALPPLTHRLMA